MNHFQRYLAEEFAEDYAEGRLSRRAALKLIASVVGSLAVANAFLDGQPHPAAAAAGASPVATPVPTCTPAGQPAPGATAAASPAAPAIDNVSPDDAAITAGAVRFPDHGVTLLGYLAQPRGSGPYPVVLVCHENRGLTDDIKDLTRRLAKAGYVGLAVDLLSRQGGTAALNADQVPGILGNLPPDQFVRDFVSGWHYTQTLSFARADQVGMVGFCFGGGVTWLVAEGMPELKAAVPFYGPPPPVDAVPNINAAVFAIYAGRDQRITGSAPTMEAAMHDHNKIYEKMIYPDTDHAFHNDTGPRYNAQAAHDAWVRTLAWFGKYLASS